MVRVRRPEAILLDIEGTTTSIKFWSETLAPYIKTKTKEFLRQNWGQKEIMVTVDGIRDIAHEQHNRGERCPLIANKTEGSEAVIRSIFDYVLYEMNERKHNNALRDLQLLVWVYGYGKGEIKGHVFEDVPSALEKWKNSGIKVYMYSAGVTSAQKLLFSRSTYGNLLPLITDFFDCADVGYKKEIESYRKIAEITGIRVSSILFLTDNADEARAARGAGSKILLLKRPGNRPFTSLDEEEFIAVKTFMEIHF